MRSNFRKSIFFSWDSYKDVLGTLNHKKYFKKKHCYWLATDLLCTYPAVQSYSENNFTQLSILLVPLKGHSTFHYLTKWNIYRFFEKVTVFLKGITQRSVEAYKAEWFDGGSFIPVLFQFFSHLEERGHFTPGSKLRNIGLSPSFPLSLENGKEQNDRWLSSISFLDSKVLGSWVIALFCFFKQTQCRKQPRKVLQRYSSPPWPMGDPFQNPQQMPESKHSTKVCVHYGLFCEYICMTKFNLQIRDSKGLTPISNNKIE